MKTYTKQDFHNPENLTRQQVGWHHRLLLPEEINMSGSHLPEIELFIFPDEWYSGNGSVSVFTYRVPLATPLPDGTVLSSNECCFSDELHSSDGGFCTSAIQKRKRVYVAGGMTGYVDYNFPTFYAASESLARQGWEPVNPAQLDVEAGYTLERIKQLSEAEFQSFKAEAAHCDLQAIQECQAIALLPGWQSSKGARAEKAVAEWLGLEIYTLVQGQGDDENEWWPVEASEQQPAPETDKQPNYAPDDPKGAAGAKKAPMHLLPPDALLEVANVMGEGSRKYGPWNFVEAKVCAHTYIAAMGRHWAAYAKGIDIDESGYSHLAHIAANCLILLTAQQQGTLNDDRPKLLQK